MPGCEAFGAFIIFDRNALFKQLSVDGVDGVGDRCDRVVDDLCKSKIFCGQKIIVYRDAVVCREGQRKVLLRLLF